jgi:hypothetical protein
MRAPQNSNVLGRRFLIIDEEKLQQLILELSPDIRRDTERMGDLIRELVKLEREKTGLDNPRGTLELYPYKKKDSSDPDITGTGHVAGRFYRAAGWISKNGKLRIALLPQNRK